MGKEATSRLDERIPRVLAQSAAWYVTSWFTHCALFQSGHWRSYGTLQPLPIWSIPSYFYDFIAWGEFLPRNLTLLMPLMILSVLALARVTLNWRVAIVVGMLMVFAQYCALIARGLFVDHRGAFEAGWIYFALRPLVVLPCPLAAVVVSQIDLSKELRVA